MARICQMVMDKRTVDQLQQNVYANNNKNRPDAMFNQITNKNNTFYYTADIEECLERLKNNESDYATSMVPYYRNLNGFHVPVLMFPSKIQIITGYEFKYSQVKPKECATVLENLEFLHPNVYLAVLALIFSAILVIAAELFMRIRKKSKFSQRKRSTINLIRRVVNQLGKELSLIHNGSSIHFKWMSFLFNILCLYLLVSFNSQYKTSHVIVKDPYVVKDYKMLLEDKKSLPIFLDSVSTTSDSFRLAPEDSLKKKIWSKLVKSKSPLNEHIVTGNGIQIDFSFGINLFQKMNENNSAFFATTLLSEYIHTMMCCMSKEEKLWRLFRLTDESEDEQLLGYPVANHYTNQRHLIRSMRRFFESHLSTVFYHNLILETRAFVLGFIPTSYKHQYEQRRVCSPDFKFKNNLKVHGIGFNYNKSFWLSLILMIIFAIFVYIYEIFATENNTNKSKPRLNRRKKN